MFDRLAILTPSRITTMQRQKFAAAACDSLRKSLNGAVISHVVVHDSPALREVVPESFRAIFESLRCDAHARDIYTTPELIWVQGDGRGSATALLQAVNVAIDAGKEFGFIHLDDHVYCDRFGDLLSLGLMAMQDHDDLLWTRFSGYPVIYDGKSKMLPNTNDEIVFDGVRLSPRRESEYTVWTSRLSPQTNDGDYWPIAMWFCIYRLPFLKTLLEWAIKLNTKHLAHVELYYKNRGGFPRLLDTYRDGSFGYINMQYGGIEMHRNINWRALLSMPNDPVK